MAPSQFARARYLDKLGVYMDSAAPRIRQAMQAVSVLRRRHAANPSLHAALVEVKRFQARRFRATYADLLKIPRYRQAALFFLDELYGDRNYEQRDHQFARIANTIARLFPVAVADTAATLAEVHALTEKLDDQMALCWLGTDAPDLVQRYIQCWRAVADRPARQQQLQAVLHLGEELDRLTRTPGLRRLLKMMRAPAAMAGLSSLQHFLEAGFDAFADMNGAAEFLRMVGERESAWIDSLFDADAVACETEMQQLLASQHVD